MAHLSERDYLGVLDAVGRLNEEADPHRLPRLMLDTVRRLVRAESVTFNDINTEDGRQSCFSDTPDIDAALGTYGEAWSQHMGEHPLIVRSEALRARGRAMSVSKISDFLNRRELKAGGLYQAVYRHLDTEFQMVVTVVSDRSRTVGIALNRKLRDFSDRDREVLLLLEPHLRTSYASAMQRLKFRRLFDADRDDAAVEDIQQLGLTAREAQTLLCIVRGKTNEQIAVELRASPRTIHKHVEHVFRKFQVSSRAAAMMKLISHMGRFRIK